MDLKERDVAFGHSRAQAGCEEAGANGAGLGQEGGGGLAVPRPEAVCGPTALLSGRDGASYRSLEAQG